MVDSAVMPVPIQSQRTLRFGVFEVDLRAGELRKQGLKIRLQEQPLQVLAMLVERPGEVVTREELRQRLWPADTFVDFDHSLNTIIKRLRDALGDSAENPCFVETLASRGYRFIAPIEDARAGYGVPIQNAAPLAEPGKALETAATVPDEIGTPPRPPAAVRAPSASPWHKAAIAAAIVLAVLASGSLWLIRRKLVPIQQQPGPNVIAVLPFVNLSSDPENEYFSDGLTEEIIQSLSVVKGLEVTSRTSSFALKGARLGIREIGGKLNATILLEGSVRRVGDQLRVTAQLIRAADDRHLWSSTYEREMHDVFAIQEEIADSIANALRLKLGTGQRHYTENLEAYDLYLRGRYAMERFLGPGRSSAKSALQYFEQAIAKDATYALAYAGAADALLAMEANFVLPHDEAFARAKSAAGKSLELDPMLSEAHTALASIRAREYAWQEAERSFRRAIELNPNNALAHQELGIPVLIVQGRFDEGLGEIRRAAALDPLSPSTSEDFALALLIAGRYKEAENQARKAGALDPSRPGPATLLGRALSLQGRAAEALAAIQEADRRAEGGGGRTQWLTCAYVRAGQRDQALRLLEKNLQGAYPRPNPRPSPARRLAEIYACLGDKDRAFEYLEKAYAEHEAGLPYILEYPELAWMRSDSRFTALRQKVGLTP